MELGDSEWGRQLSRRRLNTNARSFALAVWRYKEGRVVMAAAGWEPDPVDRDGHLILPLHHDCHGLRSAAAELLAVSSGSIVAPSVAVLGTFMARVWQYSPRVFQMVMEMTLSLSSPHVLGAVAAKLRHDQGASPPFSVWCHPHPLGCARDRLPGMMGRSAMWGEWMCNSCRRASSSSAKRFRCIEGCDYDLCDGCRATAVV